MTHEPPLLAIHSRAMQEIDVAIVGAGAAGLMAAIFAARELPGKRVVAFDGARKIGAKILISGGGRCNVTHDVVTPEDFSGSSRNQIAKVLRTFTVDETIAFFDSLDVRLKREETGKLFPVTDRARTVLDALLRAASEAGAEIAEEHRVEKISRQADVFLVETSRGAFAADSVILATGGRSVPKSGSDGAGYGIARELGHTVTNVFPALVPLTLPESHWGRTLSGISLDAELRLELPNGKLLHRERGPMLFTHFGLSGPSVLDISRHWIAARRDDETVRLVASVVPSKDHAAVDAQLVHAAYRRPRASVETILEQWLAPRLAVAVLQSECGLDASIPVGRLARDVRKKIVHTLTALVLPVTGDRGFDYAEVTAGGVPLDEIDLATMESRIVPRLLLCGEILDVDGKIGGYNFQWAWASGRLAGMSAART